MSAAVMCGFCRYGVSGPPGAFDDELPRVLERQRPAAPLPPSSLATRPVLRGDHQAEDLRLAGIFDAASREPQTDAVLDVLDQGERAMGHLLQERRRKRHSVSSKPGRDPHSLTCARAHGMEQGERQVHQARTPRDDAVGHGVVGLHGASPPAQAGGERPQQVRRDVGVGVDDGHGIRDPVPTRALEGEGERVPLAGPGRVRPLEHDRARGTRARGGRVVAVVRDDEYAPEMRRVVDGEETLDRRRDTGLLVVSRDDHVEAKGQLERCGRLVAAREQRERGEVRRPRENRKREREEKSVSHDRVELQAPCAAVVARRVLCGSGCCHLSRSLPDSSWAPCR